MVKATLIATLLSTVVGQAPTASSDYDQFTEYGQLTVGTWEGEFASQIALPEVVEKGDTIKFRSIAKWILNKQAIESNTVVLINGVVAGNLKGLTYWDQSTNEIVGTSCGSFGGYTQSVFRKDGAAWIETRTGVSVDGKKIALRAVVIYAKDGNSAKAVFPGDVELSGEVVPPLTIALKRVDGTSPTHQDYIDFVTPYFPGQWDHKAIDKGGNVLAEGTTQMVMAPGKACVISHSTTKDGTPVSTGMHGYNSQTRRWEVTEHFVDGTIATLDVNFDAETLKGGIKDGFTYSYELTKTTPDGKTSQSSWTAHIIDRNTLEMSFVKGDNADGATVVRYRRRK